MKTIEQFQIRKIYAIGNALGITSSGSGEDELHTLVSGVTGKDSIKILTYKEAVVVIARLDELQGKTVTPKPRNNNPNEVQLGDRLCAIIKKEFHADAIAKNPFAWITFENGNHLIEIIKNMWQVPKKEVR